jgi:DNA-binding GntR family transcriptional regulator
VPTPSEVLRRRIVADINAGEPGAKLGSERDLAERYGTSRSSLRQVLAALEEAGLIHRVIGRSGGIFISHGQVQRSLSDVVGVPAFLANQGYVAGTRVLSTKIAAPDRTTQKALRIGANDYVIEIQRVRLADGSPISLELAQFPADAFPGLLEARRLDIRNPRNPLRSRNCPRRGADRGGKRHTRRSLAAGHQTQVGIAPHHPHRLRPARNTVRVFTRPVPG